jgi:hypothetical protein
MKHHAWPMPQHFIEDFWKKRLEAADGPLELFRDQLSESLILLKADVSRFFSKRSN